MGFQPCGTAQLAPFRSFGVWRPPRARAPSLNSHTVVSSMIEYCKQVDAQTNSSRLPRTMQIFTFVATLLYRHFGLWWGRQLRRRCDGKTLSPLGFHHPRLCFVAPTNIFIIRDLSTTTSSEGRFELQPFLSIFFVAQPNRGCLHYPFVALFCSKTKAPF